MKRLFQWMMAATLIISGAMVFTACSRDDNPAKTKESRERREFEVSISGALNDASNNVRLSVSREVLRNLTNIVSSLDGQALKELKNAVIQTVLNNADYVFFDQMSEEEYAVAHKNLEERFGMTEEDFSEIVGFMMVDANRVFGHLKVTFQNGTVTLGESDDFTVEHIGQDGRSTSLAMKFSDVQDGVRFFVDRVANITPIGIQFPKKVEFLLKTADGKEMPGTLNMSSESPFQYLSLKNDEWHVAVSVDPKFDGHHDNYELSIDHYSGNVLDVDMDIKYDGVEKFNVSVKNAHDFRLNMGKLLSLNTLSTFADLLGVFGGGVVDGIQAVLNNRIVAKGMINDVSTCLKALANIHKLASSKPGYDSVDAYTQQLNENLDFSISLKDHSTEASSSLVTYKADSDGEGYLPYVALQYPEEPAPMVMFDRLNEQDKADYVQFSNQINALGIEAKSIISIFREKIQFVTSFDEY